MKVSHAACVPLAGAVQSPARPAAGFAIASAISKIRDAGPEAQQASAPSLVMKQSVPSDARMLYVVPVLPYRRMCPLRCSQPSRRAP